MAVNLLSLLLNRVDFFSRCHREKFFNELVSIFSQRFTFYFYVWKFSQPCKNPMSPNLNFPYYFMKILIGEIFIAEIELSETWRCFKLLLFTWCLSCFKIYSGNEVVIGMLICWLCFLKDIKVKCQMRWEIGQIWKDSAKLNVFLLYIKGLGGLIIFIFGSINNLFRVYKNESHTRWGFKVKIVLFPMFYNTQGGCNKICRFLVLSCVALLLFEVVIQECGIFGQSVQSKINIDCSSFFIMLLPPFMNQLKNAGELMALLITHLTHVGTQKG